MKKNYITNLWLVVFGLFAMTLFACTGGGGGGGSRVQIPSLMSPDNVTGPAAAANNEGVDHLVQGHYKVALKHFKKALASKPDFAEAHFNMAISLDGMGKHPEATASFKKAKEFGENNQKIVENITLKKHLNL